MNGTYIQSGKYKITYESLLDEANTISLTSEDIYKMRLGERVIYKHFVFTYKYEANEIYEELKTSISNLRDLHQKSKELDFHVIINAISILYRAVQEATSGGEYSEEQVTYILLAATKNIPYLQKKLENIVQEDTDLYAKASRQIFEMKTCIN